MLSFPTNLTDELRERTTGGYWYLRLYYGAEGASDYTGLSDADRTVSGVKYRGLVESWGTLIQSVDLPSLSPGILAMNGLTLNNTDDSISGGRFTDLFASQNYVNRKWVLYQGAVGVADADHLQIGQGIITDQIKQNSNSVTLQLLENLTSVNVEVPTNRVNTNDHPNAPENNIGKPIPMAYGDFSTKTDIGTIPTSGAEFDRHFVNGHFPAIITDKWNETDANVVASPDAEELNYLFTKHLFYYGDNKYSACGGAQVTEDETVPEITFKGGIWRAYFPLKKDSTYDVGDYAKTIDGLFNTSYTMTEPLPAGSTFEIITGFRIPKIPKLGVITEFNIIFDFGTFSGTAPVPFSGDAFAVKTAGDSFPITWDGGDQTIDMLTEYTADEQDAWDFEKEITINMDDTGGTVGDQAYTLNQIGVEVKFTPSQNFSKSVLSGTEIVGGLRDRSTRGSTRIEPVIRERYLKVVTPEITDYVYYAGKGREYGAWIDTINATARATFTGGTDPGYNSGALIENVVYIIEDILRTELGLDPSTTGIDIDVASFDEAGNTTNGTIGLAWGGSAVSLMVFAFAQYKFMSGWALCQELAKTVGGILFLSGDGKVKIAIRKADDEFTSSDKTIRLDELKNIKPGITPLDLVRNRVSVNYDLDYATDALQVTTPVDNDTTSYGSGANGINAVQELILDNRFVIDSDVAETHSLAVLNWLAYRKKTLSFDIPTPKHNDLEIGDTIEFEAWPDTFKIYGNEITSTDIYMITQIAKRPNGCSITCQEVSEVTD